MRTIRLLVPMLLLAATTAVISLGPAVGPARAGDDYTPPKQIQSSLVPPVYPVAEKKAGIEGEVLLAIEVQADGTVSDLKAEQEVAGHPAFTKAAIAAVGKWRFEPARDAGNPVACSLRVPVRFRLDCTKK